MPKINSEIISNLYVGNPYSTAQARFIDDNYPHTNIRPQLIDYLLNMYKPKFWLELGSFVGGSAIEVAASVKRFNLDVGIVCCDPFCGDVNMWDWEKDSKIMGKDGKPYKFLTLENGLPTIYQRFLANIFFNGHADVVTPIQVTSIVGIKLIERLHSQSRISQRPAAIYLDSAHEADETYLELQNAWRCLTPGGILLGDDWSWDAVRNDVIKFASTVEIDLNEIQKAQQHFPQSTNQDNIFLLDGQWVLFKPTVQSPTQSSQ